MKVEIKDIKEVIIYTDDNEEVVFNKGIRAFYKVRDCHPDIKGFDQIIIIETNYEKLKKIRYQKIKSKITNIEGSFLFGDEIKLICVNMCFNQDIRKSVIQFETSPFSPPGLLPYKKINYNHIIKL